MNGCVYLFRSQAKQRRDDVMQKKRPDGTNPNHPFRNPLKNRILERKNADVHQANRLLTSTISAKTNPREPAYSFQRRKPPILMAQKTPGMFEGCTPGGL